MTSPPSPSAKAEWFEMEDAKRRWYDRSVWIPLYAVQTVIKRGEHGQAGHVEEFFGAASLVVPLAQRNLAAALSWNDLGIGNRHRPYVENGEYCQVDVHRERDGLCAKRLVVVQDVSGHASEWHLDTDLVVALNLVREQDTWLAAEEGYAEVVKLHRKRNGHAARIEIKAEFLKDYLRARESALRINSFRQRQATVKDASFITWSSSKGTPEQTETDRFYRSVQAIHEGGMPYGEKTAVFHVSRIDLHGDEDVPTLGEPTEGTTASEQWEKEDHGEKLFTIRTELFRSEWVEPSVTSPRVKGDQTPSTLSFIVGADGARMTSHEIRQDIASGGTGRWLWFKPEVVQALMAWRGSSLAFNSRQTGDIGCGPTHAVHFGINEIALVTVYAKDIVSLPEWQQRVWNAFNVSPEAGIGSELFTQDVKGDFVDTKAPESYFERGLMLLAASGEEIVGHPIWRRANNHDEVLSRIHRFRSLSQDGLFALAKDVMRLVADAIDAKAIQTVLPPIKGNPLGSLKSLERLVALGSGDKKASEMMGPLFGAYDLRLADAHPPKSELEESYNTVGIDIEAPFVQQGEQLLDGVVSSLWAIAGALAEYKKRLRRDIC